ncbi:hypothetical protein PVAND_010400 [Polypedilum vanderplanki]|uniref:RING-type domain-containing protein n=1 Tax=Polypedilum vanderplanki TaxID=319348 RepID=A0A9J6CFT4_POLVA|nr:hypothetical protein PVAND_010400 [Polypedilum vanderplanki]
MDNINEEKRSRKRKFEPVTCPICSITIRENELETHYKNELEKLSKIKKIVNKNSSLQLSPTLIACNSKQKEDEASTSKSNADSKENNNENCWDTYQKIKENRVRRTTRIKNRKRKIEDRACPICFKTILNDLQNHVEMCLRKQDSRTTSDESEDEIDVGETYNWCGQTRIRATTLIEGSLSSSGIGTCITKNDNEDEMVNIDEDDQTFGPNQYSERDIILLNKEDERLHDLISDMVPSTSNNQHEAREENNQNIANSISSSSSPVSFLADDIKPAADNLLINDSSNNQMIIESLKAKIREYENAIRNRPKCLICLSPDFEIPVVSVMCWHVYCEKCWLHTLGAKKLCPQCNMITSASDLRRIYL